MATEVEIASFQWDRGLNQQEIGEMLALNNSSVSVSRKRYRVMTDGDRKHLRLAERIESELIQEKKI